MIGVILGTGWAPAARASALYAKRIAHTYNTSELTEILDPLYELVKAGCTTIVLTNAAGGLNPDLEVGEVVCIRDHLNLSGHRASNDFHEMSGIYSTVEGFRTGVYAQVPGPAFETPAEARMLRAMGADMVGMSTALEASRAHVMGLTVVGLSFISNVSGAPEGHDDVLAAAAQGNLGRTLGKVIDTLHT